MNTEVGLAGAGSAFRAAVAAAVEAVRRQRPYEVVGVCTHLGGLLHWNDAERSWDSPQQLIRVNCRHKVVGCR